MMVDHAPAETCRRSPPWQARCRACGAWIATSPGDTPWVQTACFNWRVNREIAADRKCPLYGKMQTVHKH